MGGGLLLRTYFVAGKATRISHDGAAAVSRRTASLAAWCAQRLASIAGVLSFSYWWRTDSVARHKRLQRKLLEISAAEQRRIGQDLHDSVGQVLSGLAFMSKALERKFAAEFPDGAADAAQIAKLAEEAMAQTRSIARVLDPARLEAGGLAPALVEMASDFEKIFGVACTFEHDGRVVVDDEALATHLYRITQEAVTNAVRHGGAKHVAIRLGRERERAALTVRDNGKGFAARGAAADGTKGMGLRIMHYRARMIGGALTIRRRPEGGSLLTCSFPGEGKQE